MSPVNVRKAIPADEAGLRAFLESAGLPTGDVSTDKQAFVLALEDGHIVGSVALEVVGLDALIRSLAVAPAHRKQGLGAALNREAVALARMRGLRALYLLTTTAREYALRYGFEVIDRAVVPQSIAALPQFRSLCPQTATCMRLRVM
jgi:amino-acid N-acetyltransferase